MLRSAARSCALLVGGFARTAEAAAAGGERLGAADRGAPVRRCGGRAPRIEAAGDDYATGADSAAARARLSPGRVRRRPGGAGGRRTGAGPGAAARVPAGAGLLTLPAAGALPALPRPAGAAGRRQACLWLPLVRHRRGPLRCAGLRFRPAAGGLDRRRADRGGDRPGVPGVPVINSSGQKVRATVAGRPGARGRHPRGRAVRRTVATAPPCCWTAPRCWPPDLRAAEETLRRWMAAAALVRPAAAGGRVVVGADASLPVVQALIRWDPAGSRRRRTGRPPRARVSRRSRRWPRSKATSRRCSACSTGCCPADGEVLGPVALDDLGTGDDAARPDRRRADSVRRPSRGRTDPPEISCGRWSGHRRPSARR